MNHHHHHTMAGLPEWALWAALASACALTAWGLARGRRWFPGESPTGTRDPGARLPRAQSRGWRLELTALRPIRWLVSRRPFQFAIQLPLVAMLGLILWCGFEGTPVADRNLATVMTWTIWWTLLILDVVLLGRMWCLACPWDALASWTRRLAFWRRTDEPLALDLKWPKWLRNVYPATILFIGLTWLELGYGVTLSPMATASLGLLMIVLAVVPALFFERRSFCRYGCLIGRVVGLYSTIAPIEVRARDRGVCRTCKTKDCLQGNDAGYPCPMGQCLGTMQNNVYCTVCTECFKTCPNDNVALNLRPWCSDLHAPGKPRRDEATLALVIVSLTSFHGLTMTPVWNELLRGVMRELGVGRLVAFSLLMLVILALPFAIYAAVTRLAVVVSARRRRSLPLHGVSRSPGFWPVAAAFAYPLIAVALMYHLAHNAGHFLMEGANVVPVLSDPFGSGADYLGTAGFEPRALVSMNTVWTVMIVFVLIGHWWATRAFERAGRNLARRRGGELSTGARITLAVFPLAVTAANLWLLAQPMEMRTGM